MWRWLQHQLRNHVLLQRVREAVRRRPSRLLVPAIVVGLLLWGLYGPSKAPVVAPEVAKARVPALGAHEAQADLETLQGQKEAPKLRQQVTEQTRALEQAQRQLAQVQRDQETERKERKEAERATQQVHEAKIAELMNTFTKAQDELKKNVTAALAKAGQQQQRQKAAVVTKPPPPTDPHQEKDAHKVSVIDLKKSDTTLRPIVANRQDIPYLQAGSFAKVRVITGGAASSRAYGGIPFDLEVLTAFTPPQKLGGPGRPPVPTSVPMAGCFVLAASGADMASSRAFGKLETLSCVMPDGAALEQPIRGYTVGRDGQYGFHCEVERHESAMVARAAVFAILQEAGAAFALARSRLIVTNYGGYGGGGQQPFSGIQGGFQKLTDLYIQQAELLLPTCRVKAGDEGWIVLEEGVPLEGMPTNIRLAGGE